MLALASHAARAQSAPLLTGRVVDATTGAALGNVEITLSDGARTTSATDGRYRLRALEPGTATVQARRPGFALLTRSLQLSNGQSLTLPLAMTPIPATLMTRRVTDSTGAPVAGTSVIDRATIDRAGARDLGELLRGQPGVVLVPRGGPGAPVTISIRGSSADQVLVLVDGTPINNPVSGEADLSLINPAVIERVEIIRGAQSSRYGSQALGGVIIVTTRQSGGVVPELMLGGGQWGERRVAAQTALGAQRRDHAMSAVLGVSWQQLGGNFVTAIPIERGGGVTRRANADADRLALNGSGSLRRGTTILDLRGELADIDRGMPGSIVQPSLFGRQTQRRIGVATTVTTSTGRTGGLRGSLNMQQQAGRFSDAAPPFGVSYDQRQRVTSLIAALDANAVVHRLALTTGAEVRRVAVSGNGLAVGAPRFVSTGGAWFGVARPFVGEHWRLDVGSGARADAGTLWRGASLSPDVHASVRRGGVRMGASWRSAFSAPSLGDLFFQEGVQVQANPVLRPERVRGEASATVDIERFAVAGTVTNVSLSAFRGDIDDLILWSPDFRFVWSPDNFDVSRQGLDASMRVALASNRAALTVTGGMVDIRYRGPVLGGQIVYRPRFTGAATGEFVHGAVDLQMSLQTTGRRRTVVGSEINQLPAFQLMQLRIARQLDLGPFDTKLRLSVENLLDQSVAMLLDFPFPGRTWSVDFTLRPRARTAAQFSAIARSISSSPRFTTR
jgi:outer membrane receptor protein involved in Fe transport